MARMVAHVPTVQRATNRGDIKQRQPDFRCFLLTSGRAAR